MKLLWAKFENFRLLRNLEINFSNSSEKNLIVIRAANESGKTTIHTAMQWALYGEEALPKKGKGYRLHPIDWDADEEGNTVPVTVTVEFETSKTIPSGKGNPRTESKTYRIIRTVREELGYESRRSVSTAKFYEITDNGNRDISHPDQIIEDSLPKNLREVFFTDGDRALSFIEAGEDTKRERVKSAVRLLLGLEIIESAQNHLKKTQRTVNNKIKQSSGDAELTDVASRLDKLYANNAQFEKELADAQVQVKNLSEYINEMNLEIESAMKKGDKEELAKQRELIREQIAHTNKEIIQAEKEHANLFRESSLADDLLSVTLQGAYSKLKDMHDKGKIPKQTVPILEERLEAEVCICGESLASHDENSNARRKYIQQMIDNSRQADGAREVVTSLYYRARPSDSLNSEQTWLAKYNNVMLKRERLHELQEKAGRQEKDIEKAIDNLGNADIQSLKIKLRENKDKHDRAVRREQEFTIKLESLNKEVGDLERRRADLSKKVSQAQQSQAEMDVVNDIQAVFDKAFSRIMSDELSKVSEQMNDLFLKMILSDPEQKSLIRRTEISEIFDILVYGGDHDRLLNPDTDLNGASRRALSLSFILALTKVSEVDAPNVIDTPLGMTSGLVRQSILKTALQESSQLVLFLTHDEIKGCESIIKTAAGKMMTLTNTSHYPEMLEHPPESGRIEAVVCSCGYNDECQICQRRNDTISTLHSE